MGRPRIALTSGEPAGIGPDLCLAIAREEAFGGPEALNRRAAQKPGSDLSPDSDLSRPAIEGFLTAERLVPDCELVCIGDHSLFAERAAALKLPIEIREYDGATRTPHTPGVLQVLHVPLVASCTPGKLDPANSRYVLDILDRAIDGAAAGEFDAIVTAPVQKSVINDAGIPFTGHTEYLAERTRSPLPVMMLATEDLRVALATTHLPLKDVSAAITVELLCQVLEILDHDLREWWGLRAPRISVCGLNPHAGESGHLGDEELRIIGPAIARMRARGINVAGPVPADTAFVPARLAECDAVLAMYHDQGLPVIKHSGFDRAVNVTLGLPIVRTSVDHGTALDLAGTGRADHRSLAAAIRLALGIASRRAPARHAQTS